MGKIKVENVREKVAYDLSILLFEDYLYYMFHTHKHMCLWQPESLVPLKLELQEAVSHLM